MLFPARAEILCAPEAEVGTALAGPRPTAMGAGQIFCHVGPGATAQHTIHAGLGTTRIALRRFLVIILVVPVQGPFPHVTGDVAEAEITARKLAHFTRTVEHIEARVFHGRTAVAPRIFAALGETAAGALPFGFCRESLAGPPGI